MTCSLYWIHLPEHTDILSEGYIGVSTNPKRRLTDHKYMVKRKTHENPHLLSAFEKYKNIISTILLKGSEDFCYDIEKQLRPVPNIGWNINKGGNKPPALIGNKHAENGAKHWILTDSQGKESIVYSLRKFCLVNNLSDAHLVKVAQGKRKQHKGWSCRYA